MDRIRVFVATTAGPSEVLGLTEEDPAVHSAVCLGGSEQDLPISPSYHRFVREPTGIIERHFGHPAWRMDVSDRIEVGDSWKLGIVAAHCLYAAGRLATRTEPDAEHAIWLTGSVTRDLSVGPVGQIPEKLSRSTALIEDLRDRGVAVSLFMPADDAAQIDPDALRAAGAEDLPLHAVRIVDDMTTVLGLVPLATADRKGARGKAGRKRLALPQGIDFSPFMKEKLRGFVGRQWLLDMVQAWLESDDSALLITGDPGAGKSAFAVRLVDAANDGTPGPDSRVAAYFCCQADSPASLDAAHFVRTLADMLGSWRDEIDEALHQPRPRAFLDPAAITADPLSALDFGILAPLSHVPPPAEPHAIVVDGLDEALAATEGQISIADMLARRLERFPPWLKLIVTGRPLPRILSAYAQARRIDIGREDDRNVADIRRYVRERVSRLDADERIAARQIEERVVARCDGNMLCARQLIDMARSGDELGDAGNLPLGLAGAYQQSFARMWPTEQAYWPVRNVLTTLIAAREPLSFAQLAAVAAANGDVLAANTIDALTGYVRQVGNKLVVYHQSLVDWLTAEDRRSNAYWIDTRVGLSRLVAYCRQWRSVHDVYPLIHFTSHLREAGAVEELASLMSSDEFAAAKAGRGASTAALRDDYRNLCAVLLSVGRDEEVVTLAGSGDAARRDGVLSGLLAANLRKDRAERIASDIARAAGARHRAVTAADLNGWRVAVTLACAHGLDKIILRAAAHDSGPVRATLVAPLYRLWQHQHDAGWTILDALIRQMSDRFGLPRTNIFEVVGGVSFAILGWHFDDDEAMQQLQELWRRFAGTVARSPIARLGGRRRVIGVLTSILRLVMARQPAYQPLNLAELSVTFARPPATRRATLAVIDCLSEPKRGPESVIAALSDRGAPFDIHLMLAAERALVLLGDRDPVAGLATLRHLHERGCPWFRQSVLYAGFHVLKDLPVARVDLADDYLAMAAEIISEHAATFATETGTYVMVPHMTWPEIVLHRHRRSDGAQFLPKRLAEALERDDVEYAARVIRACGILSFAYRYHALALDALRKQIEDSDLRLHDTLCETLANIRFNDEARVDAFLHRYAPSWLADRVKATAPTLAAADFPTWIDAFFIHLLRTSPHFRDEVVSALRAAAEAHSLTALLRHVVPRMLHLVAEDRSGRAQ